MKKTMFALALLCSCGWLHAQWMHFGMDGDRTDYINKDLQFNGDSVRFWVLQDYKKAEALEGKNVSYASQKNLYQIDCSDNLFTIIVMEYYEKRMGSGAKLLVVTEPSKALEIEPRHQRSSQLLRCL